MLNVLIFEVTYMTDVPVVCIECDHAFDMDEYDYEVYGNWCSNCNSKGTLYVIGQPKEEQEGQ
jgi:DNA-directed RNA polymerase subunit RPC12/RpoP